MTDTRTVPGDPDREPAPKVPLVDDRLADELLGRAEAEGVELLGPDGLLSQVTKAVLERALGEEMTHHLGYEKHAPAGRGSGNSRNGSTPKRLLTEVGGVELQVPPDAQRHLQPADRAQGPDPAGRVQRLRSSVCMRVACPPGTSARTCARCTTSTSLPI